MSNICRNEFNPCIVRDGTIMKDILTARKHYHKVMRSLNNLFSPLVFHHTEVATQSPKNGKTKAKIVELNEDGTPKIMPVEPDRFIAGKEKVFRDSEGSVYYTHMCFCRNNKPKEYATYNWSGELWEYSLLCYDCVNEHELENVRVFKGAIDVTSIYTNH